jgi:hypothetical protein
MRASGRQAWCRQANVSVRHHVRTNWQVVTFLRMHSPFLLKGPTHRCKYSLTCSRPASPSMPHSPLASFSYAHTSLNKHLLSLRKGTLGCAHALRPGGAGGASTKSHPSQQGARALRAVHGLVRLLSWTPGLGGGTKTQTCLCWKADANVIVGAHDVRARVARVPQPVPLQLTLD